MLLGHQCFNPRTRVGCDNASVYKAETYAVSIHAPVWGATDGNRRIRPRITRFNPRTRVGCDLTGRKN